MVCVSRVFTMSYAVVFPCSVVCHGCSRSWKTIPNRCIPQILQDFFVSEIKQKVDLTREGHRPEHSKQVQVDGDASLTAVSLAPTAARDVPPAPATFQSWLLAESWTLSLRRCTPQLAPSSSPSENTSLSRCEVYLCPPSTLCAQHALT